MAIRIAVARRKATNSVFAEAFRLLATSDADGKSRIPGQKLPRILLTLGHCPSSADCEELLRWLADGGGPEESPTSEPSSQAEVLLDVSMCEAAAAECDRRWGSRASVPIFLFINPFSGGQAARRWLDLNPSIKFYNLADGSVSGEKLHGPHSGILGNDGLCDVALHICDLCDGEEGENPGFLQLAEQCRQFQDKEQVGRDGSPSRKQPSRVSVIVAGGDGTISWVLTELDRHDINVDNVAIGVCPYGTGNDLARVLGWGSCAPFEKPEKDSERLRKLVARWLFAHTAPIDIWNVTVSTHPGGSFAVVQKDGSLALTTDDALHRNVQTDAAGCQTLTRCFINYFSAGAISQIGVAFDKHRTKSRLQNMLVYAKEGAYKALNYKSTIELGSIAQELTDDDSCVFCTDENAAEENKPSGDMVSLIFLNIPSIAGGSDIWGRSTSVAVKRAQQFLDWRQDFGDGALELMTYSSVTDFLREKLGPVLHGNGNRLHSGAGPFRLRLADASQASYSRGMRKTGGKLFMQADGEYFAVEDPKAVEVTWARGIIALRAPSRALDDALAEILDEGVRLLHFLEFLASKGEGDAVLAAYTAGLVRGSITTSGIAEVASMVVDEIVQGPVLTTYLEHPEGWRAMRQGQSFAAEGSYPQDVRQSSPVQPCHKIEGDDVDEEHKMHSFAVCVNHGVRLAVQAQIRILRTLASVGHASNSTADETAEVQDADHMDMIAMQCVHRWCGPEADPEMLQVNFIRSFEVSRAGHFLASACEQQFLFEDAAPETFRRLRALAGISEDEYLDSISRDDANLITFQSNSKSGEFFFFTHNGLFLVKTISLLQAKKLIEMLPAYETHLRTYPRCLLARYLGLHRIRIRREGGGASGSPRWFLVMASVFYTSLGLHEKYDLKGSTTNRRAKDSDKERGLPLKDLDWQERLETEGPLQMGKEEAAVVMEQHARDTELLEAFGVTDYSILLGIHHRSRASDGDEGHGSSRSEPAADSAFMVSMAVARLRGRASEANAEADADTSTENQTGGKVDENSESLADSTKKVQFVEQFTSGVHGKHLGEAFVSADGERLYFIGIIDALEPHETIRREAGDLALRGLAKVSSWAAGHSIADPTRYRERQMEFFREVCTGLSPKRESGYPGWPSMPEMPSMPAMPAMPTMPTMPRMPGFVNTGVNYLKYGQRKSAR